MKNDEDWEVYKVSNMELGEEVGLKKGLKKGREEGRDDERVRIARKMLDDGLDAKTIMKYIDVPEKEMDGILEKAKSLDENNRDVSEDVTERRSGNQ